MLNREVRGKMAGTLSLPPQVNGRIHGSLRLAVERINWRVVRPPDSSQVIPSDALVSRLLRPWHVAPTRSAPTALICDVDVDFVCLRNMVKVCFIVLTHAPSCVCEAGASKVVGRGRLWLVASSCCVRGSWTCSYELCILLHSVQQVSRLLSLPRARARVLGFGHPLMLLVQYTVFYLWNLTNSPCDSSFTCGLQAAHARLLERCRLRSA